MTAHPDVDALAQTVRQAVVRLMLPDYEAMAALDALIDRLSDLEDQVAELQARQRGFGYEDA